MPTFNVEVNVDSIGASEISYGGYKRATRVAGQVLHDRFNHYAASRLQYIANTSADAPLEWGRRITSIASHSCDACLRAKATKLHSQREMPKAYKPGDLTSFDIFTSNVPHRAEGQQYVIGFIDRYSSRKKL